MKRAKLADLRGGESAAIAGIYCDFDATTRFDKLSIEGKGEKGKGEEPLAKDQD